MNRLLQRSLRALALPVVLGSVAAGCGAGPTSASTSSSSTHPGGSPAHQPDASPTTTPALPGSLQPSAADAAAAFVTDWASGDRAGALSVATPQAVATLFAVPYASGLVIDRGCSTAFPPIVCTYGPPGGAPSTDPIYQISVAQAPGGWYVSTTQIDG